MPVNLTPVDYNILTGDVLTPEQVCEKILATAQLMPNATFERINKDVHTIDVKRISVESPDVSPRLMRWVESALSWINNNVPMSNQVVFTCSIDLWVVYPLKKPGLVMMIAVNVKDPPTRLVIMPPEGLVS